MSRGITLDAGALIAFARGDDRVRRLIRRTVERSLEIHAPAGVVAQCWRGGPRQALLARLLALPEVLVHPLDEPTARAVGELCGMSGHGDVVDVHVALHARLHRHAVVTSDPGDISRVDPSLELIVL